ncbi:MAG: acyl-CoA synthetase [Acidimicrobiales bacterium]
MPFNIADLFEHAADAVPEREALVVSGTRRTYAELEARANRFAHWLSGQGISIGDHVGIYGLNSEPWVVAMLAAFKLRAVPVNVNFRYVADELQYLFDNADLVALVHDRDFAPRVSEVIDKVSGLDTLVVVEDGSGRDLGDLPSVPFEDAIAEGSPERDFGERSPDDHYMLYTGGTTGMPKGVIWRQEDVYYALGGGIEAYTGTRVVDEYEPSAKAAESEAPMITLCTPPLMHGAAQWGTLRFFFEGNTVVFMPKFDPEDVWQTIQDEHVQTMFITGDAMARPLHEALEANPEDRWDLSSLFVLSSSAVSFSQNLKQRFLDRFPNLILVDAIGSTETGHNGQAIVQPGAAHKEGIGVSVAGLEGTYVLGDDLTPLLAGSEIVGRLARSGNIPLAYHKDPKKTAATFVTGPDGTRYAMPGDWARHEADGTITLLGRGSACINSGGEKIFPEEVEGAVKDHPAIFDTIVVGIADERWGETVCAVVQLRPGAAAPTLTELAEHCRTQIAGYKIPRKVVVVAEVVRSPSGKPDYPWANKIAESLQGVPA